MKRSRPNLPAAVIEDQDAPVARVVPKGAKLKRVGKTVLGYQHKPTRPSRRPGLDVLRVAECERLIERRYGARGVDMDEEGAIYLVALAPHILALPVVQGGPERVLINDPLARLIGWAGRWCRKALEEISYDDLKWLARSPGRRLKADALANRWQVTKAERTALDIRTIGAVDWSKRERDAGRKRDAQVRKAEARRAAGARARDRSQESLEPWKAAGVSRRTWYRQLAASRGTETSTIRMTVSSQIGTETSTMSEPPEPAYGTGSSATRDGVSAHFGTETATIERVSLSYCGRTSASADAVQRADAVQLSLLPASEQAEHTPAALDTWRSGPIPAVVRLEYLETMHRRSQRQEDVARTISISRPQLANALSQTFGLSADAVIRFKAWLASDEPPARPLPDRPRPPHHRRGGRRPPDPGPALPMLDAVAA